MLNFAGSSNASSNAQAQRRVARWVREDVRFQPVLTSDPMVQVMVSEVACTDEGCVPLETLVIIVSRDARWLGKLLVPVAEVTQEMCEGDDLKIPTNWWLYSMLFLLRQREPELSSSDVETAYDWLVAHCNDSLLSVLEAVSQQRRVVPPASASASASTSAAEDNPQEAERALLLLSKCMGMGLGLGLGVSAGGLTTPEAHGGEEHQVVGVTQKNEESVAVLLSTTTAEDPNPAATVTQNSRPPVIPIAKYAPPPGNGSLGTLPPAPRHNKNAGVRQRGCPCCDPDNIDNIVDALFMSNI